MFLDFSLFFPPFVLKDDYSMNEHSNGCDLFISEKNCKQMKYTVALFWDIINKTHWNSNIMPFYRLCYRCTKMVLAACIHATLLAKCKCRQNLNG